MAADVQHLVIQTDPATREKIADAYQELAKLRKQNHQAQQEAERRYLYRIRYGHD